VLRPSPPRDFVAGVLGPRMTGRRRAKHTCPAVSHRRAAAPRAGARRAPARRGARGTNGGGRCQGHRTMLRPYISSRGRGGRHSPRMSFRANARHVLFPQRRRDGTTGHQQIPRPFHGLGTTFPRRMRPERTRGLPRPWNVIPSGARGAVLLECHPERLARATARGSEGCAVPSASPCRNLPNARR
jgi:hypothetical protein